MKDAFSLEAKFYDKIWGKHDYAADLEFLDGLFREYRCRSIIDIGCGTGNHALRLSKRGYEVTGVDVSHAMLSVAKEKDRGDKVRFLQGDMRKLVQVVPEDQKFDAAICLGQTFYHLITNRDMHAFLDGLHTILNRQGLFIFSARNAGKIREEYLDKLLLDHMILEKKLQLLLLFYNTRHPRNRNIMIWRPIYLIREGDKVDFQMREHKLRWHRLSHLKEVLTERGFEVVAIYSGTNKEVFREDEHVEMWLVTTAK